MRIEQPFRERRCHGNQQHLAANNRAPIARKARDGSPGPAVSDAQRAALGITIRDPGGTPVGPPKTHPLVAIECGERVRHTNKAKGETDNGLLHRVP